MRHAKLFKINSSHNNITRAVTEGKCDKTPVVGERFWLYHQKEGEDTAMLTTEVQVTAQIGDTVLFTTKNSTYCLLFEKEPKEIG